MNLSETADDIISRMTNEAIQQRIPVIIFIGCLSVIGVIGNIHVLVLFSRSDVKPSTYTVFVKALSLVDLTTSLIAMPMEIFDLTRPYTFTSSLGCKLFRLNHAFLLMSSTSILVLIAFERYRRVCNPLKRQMTVSLSKWWCLLAIFLSLIITIPMFFLNGHHVVHFEGNGLNVTGYMCFIDDEFHGTLFLYSYLGFMSVVFVISASVLIIVYFSISRVVFSRHDSMKLNRKLNNQAIQTINTVSRDNLTTLDVTNVAKNSRIDLYMNMSTGTKRSLQRSTLKTTRPLVFITAIFIVVFSPYLILSCVISLDHDFKSNLNNFELTLYQIGIRLLLINNACNPFVYGFTDERFKQGIRSFYCRKEK